MIDKKICSWPELTRRLKKERAARRRVVFTNGCFDLLHVGHLKVLQSCKKRGDVLVVGLNSDASVRRLKGPLRPILPEKERTLLMAGLDPVDYVVVFAQDTPDKLIQRIRPDVLVKGGDWKAAQIVGREWAGKVVRIPLIKGRSTTNLIDLIVKRYGTPQKSA